MILAIQVMLWVAVYSLTIKPHLQLRSARSSLETCSLPVLQGGLISHQPQAWQGARAGGGLVHGERQKVTSTHSDNNCLPQISLQTLPMCQIKQALERERKKFFVPGNSVIGELPQRASSIHCHSPHYQSLLYSLLLKGTLGHQRTGPLQCLPCP